MQASYLPCQQQTHETPAPAYIPVHHSATSPLPGAVSVVSVTKTMLVAFQHMLECLAAGIAQHLKTIHMVASMAKSIAAF